MASESDIICLRLAKAGYAGGDPEIIGNMNTQWVLKLIQYENFCSEYEEEYHNINKNG